MATRLTQTFRLYASEDPLTIDIDNDNDSLGVDSEYKLAAATTRETNVSLCYGMTPQTLTALTAKAYTDAAHTVEAAGVTITPTLATGNVSVAFSAGTFTRTIYVVISASCGYGTREVVFTIGLEVGGAPGLTPVIYQLAPSVTSMSFARNTDDTLVAKEYSIQALVKRTEGNVNDIIDTLSGYYIYAGYDGAIDYTNRLNVGSTITVKSTDVGTHNNLTIELWCGAYGTDGAARKDSENITITRDGIKGPQGDNAFIMDIDNEMTSIPVSNDGKVKSQQVLTFGLSCFYGTKDVTSDCAIALDGTAPAGFTVDVTTDKAKPKITIAQNTTPADITELTFKATHATYGSRSVIFSVAIVKGGKDAGIQELLPSLSQISFARSSSDGTTLTPTSRSLTVKIKKTVGDTVSEQTIAASGLTVRYSMGSMPASASAGSSFTDSGITIQSSTTSSNVYIAAFNSAGTLVDRETVPIVKDGTKGDSDISVHLSNANDSIPTDYTGSLTGTVVLTTDVSLYNGGEPITSGVTYPDASTVKISTFTPAVTAITGGKRYTWTLKSAEFAVDKLEVDFNLVYNSKIYTAKFTAAIVKAGDPGDEGNGISGIKRYRMYTPTLTPPSATDSGWIVETSSSYPSTPVFDEVNHYLWEKVVTSYTQTADTYEILLIATYDYDTVRPQLLTQTAFDSEDTMDDWTAKNGNVVPQAMAGMNAFGYMFAETSRVYHELLSQYVYKPGTLARINASQWYTLSFCARDRKMVEQSSNLYGFATSEIYLPAGTYYLQFNGRCSQAARDAETPVSLAGYLYNEGRTNAVNAQITTLDDATATTALLTVTTAATYKVTFYAYKSSGTGGDAGEVVRVNWFRIRCASQTQTTFNASKNRLNTYIYADKGSDTYGCINTAISGYKDGAVITPVSDGGVAWYLDNDTPDSNGWTRHWCAFKMKSSIPADNMSVLFRQGCFYCEIAGVKLERGVMPTAWCQHEYDSSTECSHNPCGTWVSGTTYYYCNGQRDVVRALASASGGNTWWRMKKRTTSSGYVSKTEPYLDTEHWEKGNNLKFSIVDAMFAEEIFTDKLTVTKIKGANGKFTVDEDGQVTGTGCKFTEGEFSGKITSEEAEISGKIIATSGKIGSMQLQGNGLTNENFQDDSYIILRNDNKDSKGKYIALNSTFVGLGSNVLSATVGATATCCLENKRASMIYENYALLMSGGAVGGLAYSVEVISSSCTISKSTVVAIVISACTVTLPQMNGYDNGHVVRIIALASITVEAISTNYVVDGNGNEVAAKGYVVRNGNTPISSYSNNMGYGNVDEYIWVRDTQSTISGTTYRGCWCFMTLS